MRSASYTQPGETVGCIGCHEPRNQTASAKPALAALREPSRITPGPDGSWPLRFDRLIQPVLDQHCVSCHAPGAKDAKAAQFDLTAATSYDSLVRYGKPSLLDRIQHGYRQGFSKPGEGLAAASPLLALLSAPEGHYQVKQVSVLTIDTIQWRWYALDVPRNLCIRYGEAVSSGTAVVVSIVR